MRPQDWLQKAFAELLRLAPVAEAEPDDAWRAVVLISRLLGSPSSPTPPPEVLRRLPTLLKLAGLPEPEPLLERLSAELNEEDDPAGPLLDALLDIDDALGVLWLYGDAVLAGELSRRAVELVLRSASRVRPLKEFAAMRRATVRPDVEVAALWEAVARPPAVLPAEATPKRFRPERAPTARRRHAVVLPLPRELSRPQAWTGSAPLSVTSPDGETRVWLYEEAGRLRLELHATSTPPTRARLVVLRREEAGEQAATELPLDVFGTTAYADLGPVAGQGNLVHTLLAQAGLRQEDAELQLVVIHDD